MNDERKQKYLEAKRDSQKEYKKNMTDEQKKRRNDYQKEYNKNMTDEQKKGRKDYLREYYEK